MCLFLLGTIFIFSSQRHVLFSFCSVTFFIAITLLRVSIVKVRHGLDV